MKKLMTTVLALLFVFGLSGCSRIVGDDGLIAKARKEINNIAEIESLEIAIAGKSTVKHNNHLVWFITGNEYQMHRYIPMEFTETKNEEYKFVKKYNALERGQDIFVLAGWNGGYSFCVNNTACKTIRIEDYRGTKEIAVTEYPFVYYNTLLPGEYAFLDESGEELR